MEIVGISKDVNPTKEQKTSESHTWIAIVFKHNGKIKFIDIYRDI